MSERPEQPLDNSPGQAAKRVRRSPAQEGAASGPALFSWVRFLSSPKGDRLDAFTSSGKYLGTDALGRALTDAESKQLGRMLREHRYADASIVALRFAYTKLTHSEPASRDLMGRANLRLVCTGWDPNEVSLVKRLCRLAWSEWTHSLRENDQARAAVDGFVREQKAEGYELPAAPARGDPLRATKEPASPSYEQLVERLDAERADDERRKKLLAEQRAQLKALREDLKKDETALLYLERRRQGETPDAMSKSVDRPASDFYAAKKRVDRAVQRIIETKTGAPRDDQEKP